MFTAGMLSLPCPSGLFTHFTLVTFSVCHILFHFFAEVLCSSSEPGYLSQSFIAQIDILFGSLIHSDLNLSSFFFYWQHTVISDPDSMFISSFTTFTHEWLCTAISPASPINWPLTLCVCPLIWDSSF